jgi:hypothetical protein
MIGGLAGTLTIRLDNALLGALIWLITGMILGVAGIWLPLWITPNVLPWLDPVLKNWLAFSWQDGYSLLAYSAAIMTGIAFMITGLLEVVLIDQTSYSPYAGAIIMPVLICVLISGVVGGAVDNFVNVRFRKSALALDRLISFVLENDEKTVDPTVARQMHMAALRTIKADLSPERRMFYFTFTETADQGKILVDFKGHWAMCDVFLDQVAFCRPVEPPQ